MDDDTQRLEAVRSQSYPLSLTVEDAEALVRCVSNIMDLVPDDDRVLVAGDYNLITSALLHPEGPNNYNVQAK